MRFKSCHPDNSWLCPHKMENGSTISVYVSSLPIFFSLHSLASPVSCLAFAVMNLNYAKVTFHCGDLSAALLELAVPPHYHDHAY